MPEDGVALIEWNNPGAVGAHDGYVNEQDVYYQILRYDSALGWQVIADHVEETSYTDRDFVIPEGFQQESASYGIYAFNESGQSEPSSMTITLGKPYGMPYGESFTEVSLQTYPWRIQLLEGSSGWNVDNGLSGNVKPQDDDLGMLRFTNTDFQGLPSAENIISPRISLVGSQNPMVAFYMWHGFEAESEDLYLTLSVMADDAAPVEVGTFGYNDGTTGWGRHVIELAQFKDADNIQLIFRAYAYDGSASLYVDAISVDEYADQDIRVESFSIPERIEVGETGEITLRVLNGGFESVGTYSVDLYRDGTLAESKTGSNLASNAVSDFTFEIKPDMTEAGQTYNYFVELALEGDGIASNNTTDTIAVYINGPKYPKVSDLTGESDGTAVSLAWTCPSGEMRDAVTEGFDEYEPYLIEGFGDWITYDGDGDPVIYFNSPVTIPNQYEPQAWQVWNRDLAGFGAFDQLTPHSGDQYIVAWSASNLQTLSSAPNDNWLISAEVAGYTDVSFFAKETNTTAGPEYFEFLYSATDQSPESFVKIGSGEITENEWREFAFTLPDDAKYFAIRHCTQVNGQTLIIDDITYTPLYGSTTELECTGYNVYRDGELIAEGVTEPSYRDSEVTDGLHTYQVSVVWNAGESMLSEPCTVEFKAGVETLTAGNVRVYDADGKIVVRNAVEGMPLAIFAVDGRMLHSTVVSGNCVEIPVGQGMYLVRVGNVSYKVIVR